MKNRYLSLVWDYIVITSGNLIYALAVLYFIKPNLIPMGGASGIALVLHEIWKLPIGAATIALNVPLFLISYRSLGRHFIIRTLYAVIVSSLAIDLLAERLPPFTVENELLAALYGGLLMGLGLGLVISRGATTGGSDIVSKLINRKMGHLSMGRINMTINFMVIVGSAIIFRNVEAVLYAMVVQFISSTAMDGFLNGMDSATAAFIITTRPEAVSEVIMRHVKRGATAMPAVGMFSGAPKTVLMCAVRRHEMTALKKSIVDADPQSFMILSNAQEVLGRGFKPFIPQ